MHIEIQISFLAPTPLGSLHVTMLLLWLKRQNILKNICQDDSMTEYFSKVQF